jgi:Uma2 family endonuclease
MPADAPRARPLPPSAPALVVDGRLHIPAGIADLDSFRWWARSEGCPEHVDVAYLAGTLWVDLEPEELYTHNQVRSEVLGWLHPEAKAQDRGRAFGRGILLSNETADLATIPDGMFVSFDAFRRGRVRQVPDGPDAVELEGTPDMVLEVVSDSSAEKDTVRLPEIYGRAGIPEFWRIDARGLEARFEILRLTDAGYVPAQEPDGW